MRLTERLERRRRRSPGACRAHRGGDRDGREDRDAKQSHRSPLSQQLTQDPSGARGWHEEVWGGLLPGTIPNEAQWAGSGCSLWEPKPAWQHDAGCSGRTVADVSAVADNVIICDSSPEIGGWGVVAGTSISSPVIASVYALAGNASKLTYGSYPYGHPKGFYDITEGSDFTPSSVCGYLCTAGPGYDGPTGMGTPNGTAGF